MLGGAVAFLTMAFLAFMESFVVAVLIVYLLTDCIQQTNQANIVKTNHMLLNVGSQSTPQVRFDSTLILFWEHVASKTHPKQISKQKLPKGGYES